VTLKFWSEVTKGHWKWYHSPFDRIYMVSYYYPIVTLSVIYSTSKMTGPWTLC